MKKLTTFLSLALLAGAGLQMNAQEQTKLGVMGSYATKSEYFGAGVKAEIPIAHRFTISPSAIYYFPEDLHGMSQTLIEVNANAQYYFVEEYTFGVYGLAGLHYSHSKLSIDVPGGGSMSSSGSDFGVNLGAGINFNAGGVTPFAELRYLVMDGSQLMVGAGLMFNL